MEDNLNHLIKQCRLSAKELTEEYILEKCFNAGEQKGEGRIRRINHAVRKQEPSTHGGRSIKWVDFQSVLMSATGAIWQENHGTWKLTGGLDCDGEPLTVAVVVLITTEDVYVWTGF